VQKYLGELLDPANTSFAPRDEVEDDPGFKPVDPVRHFSAPRRGRAHDRSFITRAAKGKARPAAQQAECPA